MAATNILNFARALGVQVGLDFYNELLIEAPGNITSDTILAALKPYHKELARRLTREGRMMRSYYFGGPRNGQRHGYYLGGGSYHAVHVARAKWAVYQVDRDSRAIFRGYAISERKARKGVYVATDGTSKEGVNDG